MILLLYFSHSPIPFSFFLFLMLYFQFCFLLLLTLQINSFLGFHFFITFLLLYGSNFWLIPLIVSTLPLSLLHLYEQNFPSWFHEKYVSVLWPHYWHWNLLIFFSSGIFIISLFLRLPSFISFVSFVSFISFISFVSFVSFIIFSLLGYFFFSS